MIEIAIIGFETIQLLDEITNFVRGLLIIPFADETVERLVNAAVDVVGVLLQDAMGGLVYLLPILFFFSN